VEIKFVLKLNVCITPFEFYCCRETQEETGKNEKTDKMRHRINRNMHALLEE